MNRQIPQAQAEEAAALLVECEVRQASLIGSFLKETDYGKTIF
ncbi:hypothetical protein [Domibacillus robiginosus]|nr:hypothetical protein [Domibacillus robiginosus]